MGQISETIQRELKSWPGVTAHDHTFGGLEFRVNGREMGHMRGDEMVDLPFPRADGKKLIAASKASRHHFIPQSGWLSYRIEKPEDVPGAVELFRLQYKRMTSKSKEWWKI